MNKTPMTVAGAQRLREELQRRKQIERPRITAAIAEARAHGDLKENAEYHAARELQGFNEGRIQEIEAKLAAAEVIDVTTVDAGGRVVFGATVDIVNCETDERVTYRIVGEDEAEIREGRVSVTSPVARALIGKSAGDVVTVQAPGGAIEYEILEVRYL
jgi:transcription elongation factor GreA